MLRHAMAEYLYNYFFKSMYSEEVGMQFANNIIKVFRRSPTPFYIDDIKDNSGKLVLSKAETTRVAVNLGINFLVHDVNNSLRKIFKNDEVKEILNSHHLLQINIDDIAILLALCIAFDDVNLLKQRIEDPINGSMMQKEDSFTCLYKCFELLQ